MRMERGGGWRQLDLLQLNSTASEQSNSCIHHRVPSPTVVYTTEKEPSPIPVVHTMGRVQ